MARINTFRHRLAGFSFLRFASAVALAFVLLVPAVSSFAAEPVAVFPTNRYDTGIIYGCLAIFWVFILGLLVILRMKLREIERVQALCIDEETEDAPLLE